MIKGRFCFLPPVFDLLTGTIVPAFGLFQIAIGHISFPLKLDRILRVAFA